MNVGTSRHVINRRLAIAVAVVFLIVLVSSSIKTTLSAYLVPMGDYFGKSRADFAVAPSIFMVTYAVASPVVGYVADRFGGRRTMLGGLAAGVLLLALTATARQFWVFAALYGVGLAAAYTAMSYVPLGVFVNELFPAERRGVMYALLTNGTAAGFILLSPVWIMASGSVRWQSAYLVLSVAFGCLLVLAIFLVPGTAAGARSIGRPAAAPSLRKRSATVLRNRTFWAVTGPFFACGGSMAFVDVSMVAAMEDKGIGSAAVSASVAVLGALEIAGAMAAGYFADRGYRRLILISAYAMRGLSLAWLVVIPGIAGSMAFAALFGLSYMATVVASSLYVMEVFDQHSTGLALGIMWLVHQAGAALSAYGVGAGYDHGHSYDAGIQAIAALCALAALTVLLVPLPARQRVA